MGFARLRDDAGVIRRFEVLSRFVVFAAALAIVAGCGPVALAPTANLIEVEPSGRAAKAANCDMPVLRAPPAGKYRQVAIIEGKGNVFAKEAEVMPTVVQKACEAGADAIIINESRSQTTEDSTGYYIGAVAIIYPRPGEKIGSSR